MKYLENFLKFMEILKLIFFYQILHKLVSNTKYKNFFRVVAIRFSCVKLEQVQKMIAAVKKSNIKRAILFI